MFNQQIHGSKRSLRSVEDFTEFEQRTAYFNGDPIHAMKKGFMNILDRVQVSAHGPDAEHVRLPARARSSTLDRPARPGEGDRERAARREAVLRQGPVRRLPPGAVLPRPPDARPAPGAVPRGRAAATARSRPSRCAGIKDSPPYLHDGRCLTLEDTVEFFNLVLELKLTKEEKQDLVAFMRQL